MQLILPIKCKIYLLIKTKRKTAKLNWRWTPLRNVDNVFRTGGLPGVDVAIQPTRCVRRKDGFAVKCENNLLHRKR